MSHLSRLVRAATVASALAFHASLAGAQQADQSALDVSGALVAADSSLAAPAPPSGAPTVAGTSVAVRSRADAPAAAETSDAASAAVYRRAFSQSQVLMIVGGGAFLAGAIIGDDAGTIIMIGGAAVGLYGLYLYLQQQ